MQTGARQSGYTRYTFRGHTGYLLAPWLPSALSAPLSIRHSASVPPWTDGDLHCHRDSEELYLLLQGELSLLVGGRSLSLQPGELLLVRPGVPHAVIGGCGAIEHFVLRVPAGNDRQAVGSLPSERPAALDEIGRELQGAWGCRVPLTTPQNQNCWLLGFGQARFPSDRLSLAYLNYPTGESAAATRHPHRLHLHAASYEYYAALRGVKILQIEDERVEIRPGEIVAVAPGARHVLRAVHTPFEGLTWRAPLLPADKVEFPDG